MVILSFGEICPYMNQDFLKWEKYVPLYIKAGSPKKKIGVPVLIKPNFEKKGEICLSIMLAHFRMGEICPTISYIHFII